MTDHHQMPLALIRDIQATFTKIRELAKEHSNLIRIEDDANLSILLRGLGGNSHFAYKVSNPKLIHTNKIYINYKGHYSPLNLNSISHGQTEASGDNIVNSIKTWIHYLREYNTIRLHPQDNIADQYENEFDDWFEIVDEDADTKAFDAPRQILISNIITKSIEALKEEGFQEVDEVINEAEELKENISKLTKKQAFNGIKAIYAKLKIKGGWNAIKLVYKVSRDQAIAMGYNETVKFLGDKFVSLIEAL